MSDFLRELIRERFGPPPTAELRRPLRENVGDGGPDTPENCAARQRVLQAMDIGEDES